MLFSLVRKRIRQSYNKYNLFNYMTWNKARRNGTLYQMTFSAKQETRAYHGEHLTETQFRNIFKSELNSVNPLQSTKQKAQQSASDSSDSSAVQQAQAPTPWALQTYVALERRLDTAVFRAMFASSIRQAAQYVVRGNVYVNGVRIKQPGYVLKPGDVFNVEPERVLAALGREKPTVEQSVDMVNKQIRRFNKYIDRCHKKPQTMWELRERHKKRNQKRYAKYLAEKQKRDEKWNEKVRQSMNSNIDAITPVKVLETILRNNGKYPGVEQSSDLVNKCLSVQGLVRGFSIPQEQQTSEASKEGESAEAKETGAPDEVTNAAPAASEAVAETSSTEATTETTSSEANTETTSSEATETTSTEAASEATSAEEPKDATSDLAALYYSKEAPGNKADVKKLVSDIVKLRQEQVRKESEAQLRDPSKPEKETYDPEWIKNLPEKLPLVDVEAAKEDINSVLPIRLPFSTTGKLYGLADPAKPYFTPWSPRQFTAPFAVLPHHIEISFLTCHAVYLRDPVARPGHSELISPFPLEMHERAHMYYFTRRRKHI